MALATQCPHCHTTFRVAHDQLKLRAGLVRCGSCKQIFNGIENLLRPEEAERTPAPPAQQPPEPSPAPAEISPQPPEEITLELPHEPAATAPEGEPESAPEPLAPQGSTVGVAPEPVHVDEPPADDPLQRMTLVDFSFGEPEPRTGESDPVAARPALADELDALEKAIDDLQRRPWQDPAGDEPGQPETEAPDQPGQPDQAEHSAYEEPGFVKQGRRRQRIGRVMRVLTAIGLPLLLIALLGQGVYIFRNQLAAWFPQAKPVVAVACGLIGCQVGLPEQIDAVSIESSELQAASVDQKTFSLSVLLSNHSATAQAWPSIELTLNDADDKPMARRVFAPREYLPPAQEIDKGLAAKSEQTVKLYFELAQLKASGYRVYLFYP